MSGITNKQIADLKIGSTQVETMLLGNIKVWPSEGSYLSFDVPAPSDDYNDGTTRGNTVRFSALFDNWRAGMIVGVTSKLPDAERPDHTEQEQDEGIVEGKDVSETIAPITTFNIADDKKATVYFSNTAPKQDGTFYYFDHSHRMAGNIWYDTLEYSLTGNGWDTATLSPISDPRKRVRKCRWDGNNKYWQDISVGSQAPVYTLGQDITDGIVNYLTNNTGDLSALYGQGVAYISGGEMNSVLNEALHEVLPAVTPGWHTTEYGSSFFNNTSYDYSWFDDRYPYMHTLPTSLYGGTEDFAVDIGTWYAREEDNVFNVDAEGNVEREFTQTMMKRVLLSAGWGANPGSTDGINIWYENVRPSITTHKTDGNGYGKYDFLYETSTKKLYRLTGWTPSSFPTYAQYLDRYRETIFLDPSGENKLYESYNSSSHWSTVKYRFFGQSRQYYPSVFAVNSLANAGQNLYPTTTLEWNNLNYYGQSIAARCMDDTLIYLDWTQVDDQTLTETVATGISAVGEVPEEEKDTVTSYRLYMDVPLASYLNLSSKKTFVGQNNLGGFVSVNRVSNEAAAILAGYINTVPYNFSHYHSFFKYRAFKIPRITPEALDVVVDLSSTYTQIEFESIKTIKIRHNKEFRYDRPGARTSGGGYPKEDKYLPVAWPVANGVPWGIYNPGMYFANRSPSISNYTNATVGQAKQLTSIAQSSAPPYIWEKVGTQNLRITTDRDGDFPDAPFGTENDGRLWPAQDAQRSFKPIYFDNTFYQLFTNQNSDIDVTRLISTDTAYKEFGINNGDAFCEQYDAVQTRRLASWFPTMQGSETTSGVGGTGKEYASDLPVAYGIPYQVWEYRTRIPFDNPSTQNYNPMEYHFPGDANKDDIVIDSTITSNGLRKLTAEIVLPDNNNTRIGFMGYKYSPSFSRATRYIQNQDMNYGRIAAMYANVSTETVTVTFTIQKAGNAALSRTVNIPSNNSYSKPTYEFLGLPGGNYTYTIADSLGNTASGTITIQLLPGAEYNIRLPGLNIFKWNDWFYNRKRYKAVRYSRVSVGKVLPLPREVAQAPINFQIIPVDLVSICRMIPEYDSFFTQPTRGPICYFYEHDFWYATDPYSNGFRRPFFSFMVYDQGQGSFTPNSEVLLVFFPFSQNDLTNGYQNLGALFPYPRRQSFYGYDIQGNKARNIAYVFPETILDSSGIAPRDIKDFELTTADTSSLGKPIWKSPYAGRLRRDDVSDPAWWNTDVYGPIVCDWDGPFGRGLPRRNRLSSGADYFKYDDSFIPTKRLDADDYRDVGITEPAPMRSLFPTALVLKTDSNGRINGIKHNGLQPTNSDGLPNDFEGAMMLDYAARAEWTEDPWFTVCQTLSAGLESDYAQTYVDGARTQKSTLYDPIFNQDAYLPLGGTSPLSADNLVKNSVSTGPYGSGNGRNVVTSHGTLLANAYLFNGSPGSNYGYNLQSILDNGEFPSNAVQCAFLSNKTIKGFKTRLEKEIPEEEILDNSLDDTLVGVEFEDFSSGRYPVYLDKDPERFEVADHDDSPNALNKGASWIQQRWFGGTSAVPRQVFKSRAPRSENGDTRFNSSADFYINPDRQRVKQSWATQTGITNIKAFNLSKLVFIKDAGSTDVLDFPLPTNYRVSVNGWKNASEWVLSELVRDQKIEISGCRNFKYAIPGSAQIFSEFGTTTVGAGVDLS